LENEFNNANENDEQERIYLEKQIEEFREKVLMSESELNQKEEIIERQVQKIAELEALLSDNKEPEPTIDKTPQNEEIEEVKSHETELTNEVTQDEDFGNVLDAIENQEETQLDNDSVVPETTEENLDNYDEQLTPEKQTEEDDGSQNFIEESNDEFALSIMDDINIVTVNLPRATMEKAVELKDFIQKVVDENGHKLILDLSRSEFVDSTVLGVLVSALKKAKAAGGNLILVWADQTESSMFYITRMDKVFTICKTVDEGLAIIDE